MASGVDLALAAVGLLAVLIWVVAVPRRPEAVVAVPAALLLLALGVVSPAAALADVASLAPTVAFLAAILLLARLCADEGLFAYAGARMAAASGGRAPRLLALVFLVASLVTAVLSLDATVVLLTPVVLATARQLRARPAPHVMACAHLANTASLLFPVSNLTNLLAFSATGLSFLTFTAVMAGPWVVAVAVEYAVHRRVFRSELGAAPSGPPSPPPDVGTPALALATVALTLLALVATSLLGLAPAWAAAAGALVLAARRAARGQLRLGRALAATSPLFLVFVFALAIIVRGLQDNGLSTAVADLVPTSTGLPALLAVAAGAAVLANLVNNLPATLVLLPATAAIGPPAVLAMLIGVNVGPNLTYLGSLSNLLWRRVLRAEDADPSTRTYTLLGLATVPVTILASTVALWLATAGLR